MNKFMNTRELSEYLGINEKKVYSLIIDKKLPATKITGKWIFPKEYVDLWLEDSVEGFTRKFQDIHDVLLISGSNDPLLDSLLNDVNKSNSNSYSFF